MEAVGFVASLITLADTTLSLINYLNVVKQGGKARNALLNEITTLWMILRGLQQQFDPSPSEIDEPSEPFYTLKDPKGLLEQIRDAIEDLDRKCKTTTSGSGKVLQTLAWPFTQKEINRTLDRIGRLNEYLNTVLTASSSRWVREIRSIGQESRDLARDSHFRAVTAWLSPLNFRQKQMDIMGTPGTGAIFFSDPTFMEWLHGPKRVLWGHGAPGLENLFLQALHMPTSIEDSRTRTLLS
jgi:hypothetical protein